MLQTFFDSAQDFWGFLTKRKKYWLAPLVITLVVMGGLMLFAQGSAIAPFIYTLF
jgi:hypothetical protein